MNNECRINLSVCFCHNRAVDGSWRVLAACPMVFHCIPHGAQLLFCEPLPQHLVRHQYLARMDMMCLAVIAQTEVMIRRNHIRHLLVSTMLTRQFQTLLYHHLRMVTLMSAVKRIVLRQNRLFYVLLKGHGLDCLFHTSIYFAGSKPLWRYSPWEI